MTKLQQYIDYVVGMGIASSHEPKKNGTTIQKKYIPWFAVDAVKLHCVTTLQKFGEDKTGFYVEYIKKKDGSYSMFRDIEEIIDHEKPILLALMEWSYDFWEDFTRSYRRKKYELKKYFTRLGFAIAGKDYVSMRERCWSLDHTIMNDLLEGIRYLQGHDDRGTIESFPGAKPLDKKKTTVEEFEEMVELLDLYVNYNDMKVSMDFDINKKGDRKKMNKEVIKKKERLFALVGNYLPFLWM